MRRLLRSPFPHSAKETAHNCAVDRQGGCFESFWRARACNLVQPRRRIMNHARWTSFIHVLARGLNQDLDTHTQAPTRQRLALYDLRPRPI